MPRFRSFDTTLDPDTATAHIDPAVWPGDIGWYRLMERHVFDPPGEVSAATRSVRVHKVNDGEDEVTLVLLREPTGRRGRCRLHALQNYYSTDYRPLCSTPAARALLPALLRQVLRTERADTVELAPLDPDAPETAALRTAFAQLGWRVLTECAFANWVHDVEGSFGDYLAGRSSRVRNTLRRKRKALFALPGARLDIHDGSHDLDALVALYQDVYARSWKAAEPHVRFVPALIEESARHGRLRLGFFSLGERPVAVHLWIVQGGCAFIYKLAHDTEHEHHSPGSVLMAAMLEHVIERDGVGRVDFLSGDDAYKRDWMDTRREKIRMRAFDPRSVRGAAAWAREAGMRPLAVRGRTLLRRVVSPDRRSR